MAYCFVDYEQDVNTHTLFTRHTRNWREVLGGAAVNWLRNGLRPASGDQKQKLKKVSFERQNGSTPRTNGISSMLTHSGDWHRSAADGRRLEAVCSVWLDGM